MSKNKKKANKNPVQTNKTAEKKAANNKASIIAVAAVLAVIAVVLVAVFVIKPVIENKNDNGGTSTTAVNNDAVQFNSELVEYKGLKMPKTFADILAEYEVKRVSKCNQYGTAVKIGNINVPLPEFSMYYYTKFLNKYADVQQSIAKNGRNLTGYDLEKLPDVQKYPTGDGTWATRFSYESVQEVQKIYANFQRACQAKTELTEDDIRIIVDSYNTVYASAEKENISVDKHLAERYVDGVDITMFMARSIMIMYASRYEVNEKQGLWDAYTDSELEEKRKENPMLYKVAKVRVYMLETEYTDAEIDAIKTVDDFNAFAKKNYPVEDYDVESLTNLGYMSYSELEALHGETVANWAFDSKREVGELGLLKDYLGRYLVLVDEPAFDSSSYQLIVYLNSDESAKADAAKFYESWKTGEKTEESFRKLAKSSKYCQEGTVKITDYDTEAAEWFSSPERKSGDTVQIDLKNTSYVIYFVKANADEPDWESEVRTELADEQYKNEYNAFAAENFEETVDDDVMKKCYKNVNVRIEKFIKKQAEAK